MRILAADHPTQIFASVIINFVEFVGLWLLEKIKGILFMTTMA
jgi:hypothetical protein